MTISKILAPKQIRLDVCAASKKRALEELSQLLAQADPALSSRIVFDRLCARERLGSTGLGCGVAIPHGRIPDLDHAIGALIKVDVGVDFDSPDGQPVDLLFGLLVPEECTDEHLELLAQLARTFNDSALRDALRTEDSPKAVHARMVGGHTSADAA